MELIPAIDLKDGRCVRLFQGNFDAETVYSDAPQAVLSRYVALGARTVHVVDLDGARDGAQPNREIILKLAATSLAKLQVGGGLRTLGRAQELLNAGVDRAVIGSIAVTALPVSTGQSSAASRSRRPTMSLDGCARSIRRASSWHSMCVSTNRAYPW